MKRYHLGTEISNVDQYEYRRPARDASIESDVAVPGLQAVISGAMSGLSYLGLAVALGWPKPLTTALAVLAAVTGVSWLVLLSAHRRLLWELERVTGTDFDGDGETGRPTPPATSTTRVELVDQGHGAIRWVDVPLSDDKLEELARALLKRRLALSRRQLSDDGVLSEESYSAVLESFLDGGLAELKGRSRNAGVQLTGAGRAFLRQYLD